MSVAINVDQVQTSKGLAEVFFYPKSSDFGLGVEGGYWVACLLNPKGRDYMSAMQAKGDTKEAAIAALDAVDMPKVTFVQARIRSGLTQDDVAKLLGISRTSVSHLETDETKRVKPAYIALLLAWQQLTQEQRDYITSQV